jgi:flagellar P-ring protein precursor FlgI
MIENLYVIPEQIARVILNEREGVIVMGENVRISTVAVSQGNLTIRIEESKNVSQPNSLIGGTATTTEESRVAISESGKKMAILRSGITLRELVQALNAFNLTTRDLASILRSIQAAGAMQAELEII